MNNDFKNWLIDKGFSLFTAKNTKSTIFDYLTCVKRVCHWENKTIEELIVPKFF